MNLSREQERAVNSEHPAIVMVAGPGSGKTRTLIERTKSLISDELQADGITAGHMVAITFTNEAANELKKRSELNFNYCGTLHGYMLKLLQQYGERIGIRESLSVISEDLRDELLAEISVRTGYKGTKKDLQTALDLGLFRLDEIRQNGTMSKAETTALAYYQALRAGSMVDYDSILQFGLAVIKKIDCWDLKIHYLFVDEYQDSSPIDAEIYEALPIRNKFFIGDPDQCQPAGTIVELSGYKQKNIEDIVVGDEVVSFDRHGGLFVGRKRCGNPVTATAKRDYNGNMFKISAGGKTTYCTANHKWLTRFNNCSTDLCVTYMMRKGDDFRIGWCQLFNSQGTNHFSTRARLENADAAWILSVHKGRTEASVEESIIAAKYGLPTIPFRETSGAIHYTQESLEAVFSSLRPQMKQRAIKCLQDFGREIDYPFFIGDATFRRCGGRICCFVTQACNLLPGIMSLPVYSEKTQAAWEPLSLSWEKRETTVYSIQVDKHEMYVADGIGTHNSIYAFRGADVENIISLTKREDVEVLFLEDNYRSDLDITFGAQNLIEHNPNRPQKVTRSISGNNGSVTVQEFNHEEEEILFVAQQIKALPNPDEVAVLLRSNKLVDRFKDRLAGYGVQIPRERYDHLPIDWKRAQLYLTLMCDPENDRLAYAWLKETRGKNAADSARIEAMGINEPICDYVRFPCLNPVETKEVLQHLAKAGFSEETKDRVRAGVELLSEGDGLPQLVSMLMYDPPRQRQSGVTVFTYHRAKGCEWDHVFLPAFEQGIIPSLSKKATIEEERRLAFVGMTRARHTLTITHAKVRAQQYKQGEYVTTPSQFIGEAGF